MNMLADVALFLLRVAIGVIFIAHGMQKTFGAFGGPGIQGVSGMVKGLGFYPPVAWAWAVALSELLGGVFTLLGLFPRIGAALISVVMIVAIARIHGPKGLFEMQGGFEYPFLILMVCISLIITGSGKISLFDRW